MVLSEKDFLLELESDKLSLKSLYSAAAKYDCPCKRKNMTNADWNNYKNSYMQKVWKLLHERSFKYLDNPSQETQTKVFNFFNQDVKSIPCYVCRKHYTDYIQKNSLKEACNSRNNLCKFLIDLHNDVNKDTHKPIMSYYEVFKLYGYEFNNKIYTYSAIQKPVIQKPVVQNLLVQKPVVQKPVVQKHVVQKPVVEKPVDKNPFINRRPFKLELTQNGPVKLNLIQPQKEPVKKSSIQPQKEQKTHLFELNQKLISRQVFNNSVSNNRNSIVKRGMMRAINRGRR